MGTADPFETHAEEYDAWFDRNSNAYESELQAVRELLPPPGAWVEVGVGTGRFATRLGIPLGIEPAEGMAALARARGVRVLKGQAEALPLPDASVDAVFLITTLCFVVDVDRALREAARALRDGGHALVAFIPQESALGKLYAVNCSADRFFRRATLRTTGRILDAVEAAGLEVERTMQTLSGSPEEANARVEPPSEGHDRGSFVVARAVKRPLPADPPARQGEFVPRRA